MRKNKLITMLYSGPCDLLVLLLLLLTIYGRFHWIITESEAMETPHSDSIKHMTLLTTPILTTAVGHKCSDDSDATENWP